MKISEYLKDRNGKPSSKRMMSYNLMWFFIIFNIIVFPLFAFLSVSIDWVVALLGFDFMLLISIFVPTQLSKIQEVKEVIELAKK